MRIVGSTGTGNYPGYSSDEALRMGKTIIGVKPWGQERTPVKIQDAAKDEMVNWNSSSIIQAIRNLI